MFDAYQHIVYFETLDSTNDYLINLYKNYSVTQQLIVVAKDQKKGRGRMDKKWFSDHHSLSFSFSKKLNDKLNAWKVNMIISLALIKVLKKYGINASIKYPNDIIVNNKKVAGILIEVISAPNQKFCIVGVGINVNNAMLPSIIPDSISLKNIIGQDINQNLLLKSILLEINCLSTQISSIKHQYILHLYGSKDYIPAIYKNMNQYVKILSVTNKGLLTVEMKKSCICMVNQRDISFLLN